MKHTGSLLCKEREIKTLGEYGQHRSHSRILTLGFLFSFCLQAAQLSLTGSQEQSDSIPPEEQNTACVLSYAVGKTKEKIRKRKKTASISTACLLCNCDLNTAVKQSKKVHTFGGIPKNMKVLAPTPYFSYRKTL